MNHNCVAYFKQDFESAMKYLSTAKNPDPRLQKIRSHCRSADFYFKIKVTKHLQAVLS